jgi:hypothetical protein
LFHYYGDYSTIHFLSRERGGDREEKRGVERERERERENKQTHLLYFLKKKGERENK